MKKVIVIMASAFIAAAVSCQKPSPEGEPSILKEDPVFTASITAVKTSITPASGKVAWDGDEVITITDASSVSVLYEVKSVVDGKATFVKKAGEAGTLGAGPYTAVFGADLSVPQVYGEQVKDLPMTAASATTNLSFSVSCGLLRITLTKAGTSISSVAVGDGTNVYTLTCSPAVDISSGADFCIAVPAGTYKRFAFQKSDGKYCVKTAKSGSETGVAANQIQPINFSSFNFNTTLVHNITELNAALTGVADGDKILLASGTYTISSTISITNAITLEGGYTASPSAADFPDPATNKASLDGNASYRVMTVTGPAGKDVNLSGLVLQNGKNTTENGAGLFVNQGTVCLNYVDIKNNTGTKMGIGFTVTGTGTHVSFSNSVISGNTTTGNGSNYIYKAGSVSFDNCLFSGNSSPMGGGLYIYTDAANSMTVQITNSEFRNNTASNGRGGGIYLRCNAATTITLNVANSTFSGNSSTNCGSAIDVYGAASKYAVADIYSCTFTENEANNATYDGAVTTDTAGTTINIYNSIVSGNTTAGLNADLYQKAGTINSTCTVNGGTVSDYLASSASAKDGFLTKAFKVNTAATTAGMDVATIKGYYAADDDFKTALGFDQWGNERGGTTVGACVEAE